MAVTAAWSAGREAWSHPQGPSETAAATRAAYYDALWQLYRGVSLSAGGSANRTRAGLYAASRPLFQPVKRLVDFYVDGVFPGSLSEDGGPLPDGTPSAIPFAPDTDERLIRAIAQVWQWSNWSARMTVYTLYGAVTGNVLVEIVDDVERGTVALDVRWPGEVLDLTLDSAGHVKAYTLEHRAYDRERNASYTYRKQVDGATFRTFRDGTPYDYSGEAEQGAVWDNPYGFVPAVWVKHRDVGGDYGAPAIFGSELKVDETSSIASMGADAVQKKLAAPAIFWSKDAVTSAVSDTRIPSTGGLDEFATQQQRAAHLAALRSQFPFLKGSENGRVDSLATTLDVGDVQPLVEWLAGQVNEDQPELLVWSELRQMSQVTGPAAMRLVTDAARRLDRAQKMYDRGVVHLGQMAVAIGGMRAAEGQGGWAQRTRQRQKLLDFGLDSFERGELDFALLPRPLLAHTTRERWEEAQLKATAFRTYVDAGLPAALALSLVEGTPLDDSVIAQFEADRLAAIQREQALSQEDVPPSVDQ